MSNEDIIVEISRAVGRLEAKFDGVDSKFDGLNLRFDHQDKVNAEIIQRLSQVEQRPARSAKSIAKIAVPSILGGIVTLVLFLLGVHR